MVEADKREEKDELVLALTPVQLTIVAALILLAIIWRRLGTRST